MFGAIGYMPTYLQMVIGANATEAGLLMIPLMAGLLITSIASRAARRQPDRAVQGPARSSAWWWPLGLFLLSTMPRTSRSG